MATREWVVARALVVTGTLLLGSVMVAHATYESTFLYQGRLQESGVPVDGTVSLLFGLYEVDWGGYPLAVNTRENVVVNDGVFTVDLDFGSTYFDGRPLWLEISVEQDPNTWVAMSPRQPIRPGPYAMHSFAGGDGTCLWSQNGAHVYYDSGNVGIGTTSPGMPLSVRAATSTVISVQQESTTTGTGITVDTSGSNGVGVVGRSNSGSGYTFGVIGYAYSPDGIAVRGANGAATGEAIGVEGRTSSDDGVAIKGRATATSGLTYGVHGEVASPDGIGVYGEAPAGGSAVRGTSGTNNGELANEIAGVYGSSQNGHGVKGYSLNDWAIFGSIPNGSTETAVVGAITLSNGAVQWVPESGVCGSSEDGYGVSGRVDGGYAVYGTHDDTGNFGYLATPNSGAYGETANSSSYGVHGKATGNYVSSNGVYGQATGSTYGIGVRGSVSNSLGCGVYGYNDGGGYAAQFYSSGGSAARFINSDQDGVVIEHDANAYSTAALRITSSGTEEPVGIEVDVDATYGRLADFRLTGATGYIGSSFIVRSDCDGDVGEFIATNTTTAGAYDYALRAEHQGSGSGIIGRGGARGVSAYCYPDGSGTYYGLYSYINGGSGSNRAIYGYAAGGATNYAGYFSGDVQVTGTLSKGAGSFKIDHPLDPANKYLSHSFVESPDMMNIYNGNVVLDEKGAATVTMPEWFEALNREFRYQLTCIGGFAQVYVAEEIRDNQFKIAGGTPGLKVSWQVTGVRHDAYAEAHRIPVEQDKPADEVGTYLHPEAFGQDAELQVDRVRDMQLQAEQAQD